MTPIEKAARAIEGPHDPQGIYRNNPDRLAELRAFRWGQLSAQDRGVRLTEARAAIEALREPMKAWLAVNVTAWDLHTGDELTDKVIDAMLAEKP
jgi:hypothetical protein